MARGASHGRTDDERLWNVKGRGMGEEEEEEAHIGHCTGRRRRRPRGHNTIDVSLRCVGWQAALPRKASYLRLESESYPFQREREIVF